MGNTTNPPTTIPPTKTTKGYSNCVFYLKGEKRTCSTAAPTPTPTADPSPTPTADLSPTPTAEKEADADADPQIAIQNCVDSNCNQNNVFLIPSADPSSTPTEGTPATLTSATHPTPTVATNPP